MHPRWPLELRRFHSRLRCLASLLIVARVGAQDLIPADGAESAAIHGPRRLPNRPVINADPGLPIWYYQIASPVNGGVYAGYMVGTSPFERGSRTTTIPAILVPFIVQFTNTATGFTTTLTLRPRRMQAARPARA
jgi:hypothetical protein